MFMLIVSSSFLALRVFRIWDTIVIAPVRPPGGLPDILYYTKVFFCGNHFLAVAAKMRNIPAGKGGLLIGALTSVLENFIKM
ncbi:MAG: hypothetical protein IJX52_05870 [Oscillibacter sp.]|nr:hypothetical protein [Oscillibacter sp.]